MTIKVYSDRIEIGAKTITTTPTGIRIGDSLAANTQAQGYVRQANFTARELALGAFGFQGSVSGYTSGGYTTPAGISNTIDKFPFSSDTNASDVGDLSQGRYNTAGQSSTTSGYTSGGYAGPPTNARVNTIDKFPFAVDTNATDVGDLTQARRAVMSQSSSVHGYVTGGNVPGDSNIIEKFLFATNSNATDVGDLTQARMEGSGQSSTTHGYTSGGYPGVNTIDKFPFATDTNASDVGNLSNALRGNQAGQSSTSSGYSSGGFTPTPTVLTTIDKFPFASDTNATGVQNLSQARFGTTGQSSTTHGYNSGGAPTGPINTNSINSIDKFPFVTDSVGVDIGDLTQIRSAAAGQQF